MLSFRLACCNRLPFARCSSDPSLWHVLGTSFWGQNVGRHQFPGQLFHVRIRRGSGVSIWVPDESLLAASTTLGKLRLCDRAAHLFCSGLCFGVSSWTVLQILKPEKWTELGECLCACRCTCQEPQLQLPPAEQARRWGLGQLRLSTGEAVGWAQGRLQQFGLLMAVAMNERKEDLDK